MKSLQDLATVLSELGPSGPTRKDALELMVQFRLILEENKWGRDFPTLQFACHWVVHAALQESGWIYERFERVNTTIRAAFVPGGQPGGRASMTKAAATILDLDDLRAEVRQLLVRGNLSAELADSDPQWYELVCGLLGRIREKPIGFPESAMKPDDLKTGTARGYAKNSGAFNAAISFSDIAVRSVDVFVDRGKFKLQVRTNDRVHLVFTVASKNPFREYDAGSLPDADWTKGVARFE